MPQNEPRKHTIVIPTSAKKMVRWPGTEDSPMCEEHLRMAIGMGAILGFMVTWTPCESTQCTNCESQFKYLTPEERVECIAKAEGAA